mmetsp:Transcript_36750/g.88948  ORF Transcript_36750/g.88948 Transcript_36750/m.88948 type:complete len:334 (+) Transcript_36750:9776-10777(+)
MVNQIALQVKQHRTETRHAKVCTAVDDRLEDGWPSCNALVAFITSRCTGEILFTMQLIQCLLNVPWLDGRFLAFQESPVFRIERSRRRERFLDADIFDQDWCPTIGLIGFYHGPQFFRCLVSSMDQDFTWSERRQQRVHPTPKNIIGELSKCDSPTDRIDHRDTVLTCWPGRVIFYGLIVRISIFVFLTVLSIQHRLRNCQQWSATTVSSIVRRSFPVFTVTCQEHRPVVKCAEGTGTQRHNRTDLTVDSFGLFLSSAFHFLFSNLQLFRRFRLFYTCNFVSGTDEFVSHLPVRDFRVPSMSDMALHVRQTTNFDSNICIHVEHLVELAGLEQ